MLFDLQSKLTPALAVTPAARTATFSSGGIVDLKGYESVAFVVFAGAVTTADASNKVTFTIVAGDDDDLVDDGATVSGVDLLGSNPVINATADADSIIGIFGYRGTKRYCRVVATETGTTDALYGVIAILGNPRVSD